MKEYPITDWLPITYKEMKSRGWDSPDVILISGDAYIDHPAFGAAVTARMLEYAGLKVVIVPQPNWKDDLRDFKKFGRPNYFFGITAGNMDSMVNHYTANKRLRSDDAYTPGGQAGFRPDYATIMYSNIIKDIYPDVPVVIGGIEASMRRFTHYDYWSDKLMPSILIDSKADLLIYGMAEKPLLELARLFKTSDEPLAHAPKLKQIAYTSESISHISPKDTIYLASHEDCLKSKKDFAANFKKIEQESNLFESRSFLVQKCKQQHIVITPPYNDYNTEETDLPYSLPYTRLPHPKYKKRGSIPAWEMIRFSVNTHRGCFGGCAFCTISAHQGKRIRSRSQESVIKEVEAITEMDGFKGYVSDLGGPSANMFQMTGKNIEVCKKCKRYSCIHPNICSNLNTDHSQLLKLYRKAATVKDVKRVFIGSGIRYDLLSDEDEHQDKNNSHTAYLNDLLLNHVSGRLKVAPEHTSSRVLRQMRKPDFSSFVNFKNKFDTFNKKHSLKLQLIPYFISSHPSCTLNDMADLAVKTKELGYKLQQVQDFTPTPMTLATVMYYTGLDPYTGKKIYTAKDSYEKNNQRKFFFWYKSENRNFIRNALRKSGDHKLLKRLYH